MFKVSVLLLFSAFSIVHAALSPPLLHLSNQGKQIDLSWSTDLDASGYRLFYAPYPYQGSETIRSFDLQNTTTFSIELPEAESYYVAVQAYNNTEQSEFSNIEFFQIQDRGDDYYQYWQNLITELKDPHFKTDDFLYVKRPDVENCDAGELTNQAKQRELVTLNQARQLHNLAAVSYFSDADHQVQQAALIQKANSRLSHIPQENANCYSQTGAEGSASSNLGLSSSPTDPADEVIGYLDDVNNIALLSGVGHRRGLLNPFLGFTTYGQVEGASIMKIFDFSEIPIIDSHTIPDFIAFPYLHYPYSFLSQSYTPWSISLVKDKQSLWGNQQAYFKNAQVTVKEKATEKLLVVSNIYTDTKGSGIPNLLSWHVDNWMYDTWYTVSITGIDVSLGVDSTIQYDVFIDYKSLINITQPLEEGDSFNVNQIMGRLSFQEDKDTYQITLSGGHKQFIGRSQFSNLALYITLYDENKQVLMSTDESFSLDLVGGRYIIEVSNCNNKNRCYSDLKDYVIQVN